MHLTSTPWSRGLVHDRYGTDDTYRLAAAWLQGCRDVADWGAGSCYFRRFLAPSVRYVAIDGTANSPDVVLADLATYRGETDGIMLRHVVDMTEQWRDVLLNALASFLRRMVVITFTPDAPRTIIRKIKSGWPIWSFNPDDLRAVMGPFLIRDERRHTSHPERVYYLERTA